MRLLVVLCLLGLALVAVVGVDASCTNIAPPPIDGQPGSFIDCDRNAAGAPEVCWQDDGRTAPNGDRYCKKACEHCDPEPGCQEPQECDYLAKQGRCGCTTARQCRCSCGSGAGSPPFYCQDSGDRNWSHRPRPSPSSSSQGNSNNNNGAGSDPNWGSNSGNSGWDEQSVSVSEIRSTPSVQRLLGKSSPAWKHSHWMCGPNGSDDKSPSIATIKKRIAASGMELGMSQDLIDMCLAIAMQEDSYLSKRDSGKDGRNDQNYSIFNLNRDFLHRIQVGARGWPSSSGLLSCNGCNALNGTGSKALKAAMKYIQKGVKFYRSTRRFIWFHRGGGSGYAAFPHESKCFYMDGTAKKPMYCEDYEMAIGTYLAALHHHPEYRTNDRRLCIDVKHV